MHHLAGHIREHYDTHAANTSTKEERARGIAAPLKRYHNQIKRHLLRVFAKNAERLLDVACGRGGDLAKWDASGVNYVLGLDISPREIEEARRRYQEGSFRPTCHFEVCSTLATAPWTFGTFDVVSCMFALHYFCSSEDILKHIFKNICSSLNTGGYLIITVPDGKNVVETMRHPVHSTSTFLKLTALWTGTPRPFGCAYLCDMKDTVTSGGSLEYLVDTEVILHVARSIGLEPVSIYNDSQLDTLFDSRDVGKFWKRFSPKFESSIDPGISLASSLFCACVFKKQ